MPKQEIDPVTSFAVYWFSNYLTGNLFSVQFGIYAIVVIYTLRQYNQRIRHYYSFIEQISLRWLYIITCICLLFLLMYLITVRSVVWQTGTLAMAEFTPNIPYLFMALVIYIAGFMALSQRSIQLVDLPADNTKSAPQEKADTAAKEQQNSKADKTEKSKPNKYQHSTLTPEEAQIIASKLKQLIEQDQLYLDSELTMPELAQRADIAPYLVSQVLNETLSTTYFNFVNHYRIALAKELLGTPGKRSMAIVDLAMEVGFKSKSSFYDAFKKATQMTPTQYKKTLADK